MREMAIRWRCHLQERERSDLFYLVWLCWGAALLLYVLGSDAYLWPVVPMPLVLLFWLGERFGMFGRKAKSGGSEPGKATVIAAGARFKGGSLSISKGGNFIGHSRPNESSASSPAPVPANQELESVPVEGKGNVKALAKEGRGKGSEPLAKQA